LLKDLNVMEKNNSGNFYLFQKVHVVNVAHSYTEFMIEITFQSKHLNQ